MKYGKTAIVFITLSFLFGACSKDKEKVAEIEKEVLEAESQLTVPDSIKGKDTVITEQSGTAVEYAKTPNMIPSESGAESIPRPMPSPEIPAGGPYTIQVAAATDMAYANALAEKYRQRGYESYVTAVIIDGVNYFRVRIGGYESSARAGEVGRELQDKYSVNYWITRNDQ
ncbi:MAG: SPOR domain-containing protein [bacterium]|jgi:cell division septation protein DedD